MGGAGKRRIMHAVLISVCAEARKNKENTPSMAMEEEFIKSYDELADVLFRHCYFRLSDRERAKDVVQETFIRTWDYVKKGKDITNLKAFLYRVANNLIIDEYRKKKELSLDVLQEDGFDPGVDETGAIQSVSEGKYALAALAKIDPSYRQVIIMRYIDDLSPKEISLILGESENAVSVRIHRGLKRARETFEH